MLGQVSQIGSEVDRAEFGFDLATRVIQMFGEDIDYYCVVHVSGEGLFAHAKGRPTEETRIQLNCSDSIQQKVLQLRKDFAIHDNTKMLVMISISTKDMIRFVSMHPEVWFIDCTAGTSTVLYFFTNEMSTGFIPKSANTIC